MKKIFIMFLIVLSFMLIGCSSIYQHIHITCQECGKCIAEDCNGLEEDKCQGHQIVHTHIKCEECGKCIAEDCDGLAEEKCQGHQPAHTHTECQECGKCIAEDCDGLEEEKCQGCIKVNLVDKTYVSFINVDDYVLQTNYIIINSYEEYINFVIDNFLMEIQFGPSNGLYYTDEFYSVINNYDEKFFKQNSLIFCYMDKLHSRINPRMVYQVELENGILRIHETLSGDDCPPNFKGKIFYNIEVSKNVINPNFSIEFIGDKIIIIG